MKRQAPERGQPLVVRARMGYFRGGLFGVLIFVLGTAWAFYSGRPAVGAALAAFDLAFILLVGCTVRAARRAHRRRWPNRW